MMTAVRIPGRRRFPGFLVIAVLATACAEPPPEDATQQGAPPAPTSTTDELLLASAKVALPPPGLSPDSLPDPQSGGARALQRFCTACHALPSPAMHSATDWPSVTRRMWLRMGLLDAGYGIPVPEIGDRIVLLDYLTANALRVSQATLPDAPGRDAFEMACSRCHELPDPRQHSAQDWFVVVRRMEQHMRDILGTELTQEQTDRIVRYLSQVSGD